MHPFKRTNKRLQQPWPKKNRKYRTNYTKKNQDEKGRKYHWYSKTTKKERERHKTEEWMKVMKETDWRKERIIFLCLKSTGIWTQLSITAPLLLLSILVLYFLIFCFLSSFSLLSVSSKNGKIKIFTNIMQNRLRIVLIQTAILAVFWENQRKFYFLDIIAWGR